MKRAAEMNWLEPASFLALRLLLSTLARTLASETPKLVTVNGSNLGNQVPSAVKLNSCAPTFCNSESVVVKSR